MLLYHNGTIFHFQSLFLLSALVSFSSGLITPWIIEFPLFCCHGNSRLEAELEERRLREREELMCELQAMKEAAQVEMDRQKTDYETRISQLSKDMVSLMCTFINRCRQGLKPLVVLKFNV